MDLSIQIVAAIGSFMVSERVLPPKSIVVVGLGGLFMFDLIMYSHEHGALRVYRGPGLLAFVLLCSAFSLRLWRRNGVACDELLFLPGTEYGEKYIKNEEDEEMVPLNKEEINEEEENESSSEDINCEYSPSGPSVFGAALDLIVPVLFNFHLFTDVASYKHPSQDIPPQVLPIIFLSILFCRIGFPPGRRLRFFRTLCYTFKAPFYEISFRDDVLCDILTSIVGPLQDCLFAFFFYFTVLPGTLNKTYGLTEAGQLLEHNWALHSVVLPLVAISPLWWKYLQTLRLAYDTKSRWPLLNSFKYLTSAYIILHAIRYPLQNRGIFWFLGFFFATLYQIYWDVFIDWELFAFDFRKEEFPIEGFTFSSMAPSSFNLLLKPLKDIWRSISLTKTISLRPKRLFQDIIYWKIFWFNFFSRPLWMIGFFPSHHYDSEGTVIRTFGSNFTLFVTFLIPVLEISRRCLWTILRVELESIRLNDSDHPTPFLKLLFSPLEQNFSGLYAYIPILNKQKEFFCKHLFLAELFHWVLAFLYLGHIFFNHIK